MEKSIDTLSEYGSTFQTKTLSCLLSDKTFLNQIYDILSPDLYDTEAKKWIVEKIVEYYDEYDKSPTPDYLEAELKNLESETLQVSVVDETRKAWSRRDDGDLDYVKDEFLEFARNQRVKLAVLESLDSIREKNYGAMMDRIKEAMNSGTSRDIGHVYKEEVENRLEESMREAIPTGWEIINDITDGGLAPGELGVIVAPSGAGKCVGKNTKIEIEYEQIGIDVGDKTVWFDPWETIVTDDGVLTIWELKKYYELNSGDGKTT